MSSSQEKYQISEVGREERPPIYYTEDDVDELIEENIWENAIPMLRFVEVCVVILLVYGLRTLDNTERHSFDEERSRWVQLGGVVFAATTLVFIYPDIGPLVHLHLRPSNPSFRGPKFLAPIVKLLDGLLPSSGDGRLRWAIRWGYFWAERAIMCAPVAFKLYQEGIFSKDYDWGFSDNVATRRILASQGIVACVSVVATINFAYLVLILPELFYYPTGDVGDEGDNMDQGGDLSDWEVVDDVGVN